jgi:hypothetical protein
MGKCGGNIDNFAKNLKNFAIFLMDLQMPKKKYFWAFWSTCFDLCGAIYWKYYENNKRKGQRCWVYEGDFLAWLCFWLASLLFVGYKRYSGKLCVICVYVYV